MKVVDLKAEPSTQQKASSFKRDVEELIEQYRLPHVVTAGVLEAVKFEHLIEWKEDYQ